ncbi:MAG TPA: tellurite resistance TerB family protein [Candidatus Thermoplasmatota archaeon]|nr:tellurite resistance TerB family protein [Candidatus Thermoplasmatota archaeon]
MGLFDKVLGTGTDKLNGPEGFAGVAFCAVAADGVLTEEEQLGLVTTMSRMKLYEGMSQRQIGAIFDKLVKIARSEGIDVLLQRSSEAIPNELRPTAFAVSADLVMADGMIATAERAFLEKIQKSLGVMDADALRIVEVIQVKNKG